MSDRLTESRRAQLLRRHLRRASIYRRCSHGRDPHVQGYFRDKAWTHLKVAQWHKEAQFYE